MIYYVYVYTGYESNGMPYRFGCEDGRFHHYQEFMLKRDRLMNNDYLIHMDKKTNSGSENVVQSNLDKIRGEKYGRRETVDLSNNAIFKVNDNSDSNMEKIIQDCRDLDYCRIWMEDPIESIESYLLSEEGEGEGEREEISVLIYLQVNAESG